MDVLGKMDLFYNDPNISLIHPIVPVKISFIRFDSQLICLHLNVFCYFSGHLGAPAASIRKSTGQAHERGWTQPIRARLRGPPTGQVQH